MEIRVELDDDLAEDLADEADLQGFDDRAAYLRWIIAQRPMSELASSQAPAVASRVSELEERVTVVERQLDLDQPTDPGSDLSSDTSGGSDATLGETSGGDLEPEGGGLDDELAAESEPAELTPEDEDAAEDDDIAEAVGDVSLDDEDD
jgi:hypothetical protein